MPTNRDLKAILAENLSSLMKARGVKQEHVAQLAKQKGHDINQTTVGRIKRAEIPTTVDKLEALAAAFGVQPWQLLMPDLDPNKLSIDTTLPPDERELLEKYRGSGSRWKLSLRYMAGLRAEAEQEEFASSVNILLAEMLGRPHYPVEKMKKEGWTAPTALDTKGKK